jgi:MFS family permease
MNSSIEPDRPARIRGRGAVLAIIVASYLMIVVDISIVITGLPKIQAGLGFSHAGLSWVQNAYTLAFGGLLLLGARAGDILGRRRMFIAGLALFTLASVAIGLAQSPAWLLASRAVQGVGAAVLAPSTLALLATHFAEGPERTRALSYYAAAAGVGATVGLVLGGLFADLVSWRAGFFINLPIGIALMLAAARTIAETPTSPGRFDLPGALTSTLGMSALVYGLVRSADAGWGDPVALCSLSGGIVLLALFVFIEARAPQPILPLGLFASRERSGAYPRAELRRRLVREARSALLRLCTRPLRGRVGLQAGRQPARGAEPVPRHRRVQAAGHRHLLDRAPPCAEGLGRHARVRAHAARLSLPHARRAGRCRRRRRPLIRSPTWCRVS